MLNKTTLPFVTATLPSAKKLLCWTLIPAAVLLSGCSSNGAAPQWLNGEDANYPSSTYLSASGEGSSNSVADNHARANLAKIFNVSIVDKSIDFSSAVSVAGGGQGSFDNKHEVSRFISTEATQMLSGVTIAERWHPKKGGQQHSLAVLKKGPAIAMFSKKVRAADQAAERAVDYAMNDAPNTVAALSALEQARQSLVTRANDNNNLRVLTGVGITAKYSADMVEATIRQNLSKMSLVSKGKSRASRKALEAAISKVGIRQVDSGPYKLSISLPKGEAEREQGWYWLRGNIQLSLSESGTVIANKNWPFKLSAQSESMLPQRLAEKLENKLPDYVYELLTPAP